MVPGDIYLGHFPFGDVPGMKLRPLLLLTGPVGTIPEIVVAYLSSIIPATPLPSDVIVDPSQARYASTNLKKVSVLRLHKLGTIHQLNAKRFLGKLSPIAAAEVEAKLRSLLNL